MARRKNPLSLTWKRLARRMRLTEMLASRKFGAVNDGALGHLDANGVGGAVTKGVKKKAVGSRLWMRMDRAGETELVEYDKNAIIQLAGIPPRDLRILGPVFSRSSNIVARGKSMVVNLEVVRAIITAQEVLLLDPLNDEVRPFVDQLKHQLTNKYPAKNKTAEVQENHTESPNRGQWVLADGKAEDGEIELPFEFQVLEVALEVVCIYFESSVSDLEKNAYPCLDELARYVSTKNLERVRGLKANLTRLLARVQKVRDEIEHLLDDDDDMSDLYLTRKQIQLEQSEALLASVSFNNGAPYVPNIGRLNSYNRTTSFAYSVHSEITDVEDLEMLLEAYFMQLDGTRNRILSVREYIDDTEDYVNIQLDNQRNELIQLQLTLSIASFAIVLNTLIAGSFAMNIPSKLYQMNNIFLPFVGGTSSGCFLIFLLFMCYARWKKLIG